MSGIVLDARLSAIAEMLAGCECYVDIGCDHGRLGAYLLQNDRCRRAVLTDISEPSLLKAKHLIENLGLTERVQFCVADGLPELHEPFSAVVIAGMGGLAIAGILERAGERLSGAKLIMQPNVAAPALRRTISCIGYAITDERVIQDGRRVYVIIQAEPGSSDYTEKELLVGPVLLRRMDPSMIPYAAFRLRVAQKALVGARKSEDRAQIQQLEWEASVWEEVCACLAR